MIDKFTWEEIHKMTTTQLYDLNSECVKLQNKIDSELKGRGDY